MEVIQDSLRFEKKRRLKLLSLLVFTFSVLSEKLSFKNIREI